MASDHAAEGGGTGLGVQELQRLYETNKSCFTNIPTWNEVLLRADDPEDPECVEKTLLKLVQEGDERARKFRAEYVKLRQTKGLAESYTTPMARHLGFEWNDTSSYQKAVTRSIRARTGVKCEECGTVGFWRSNCPECLRRERREQLNLIRQEFEGKGAEFGLWASCILDLAEESDGKVGMQELQRFLAKTHHGPKYKGFEPWLLETCSRKLVEVSYDEMGALPRNDMVKALLDYYKWFHNARDSLAEVTKPKMDGTHWFWGKSRANKAMLRNTIDRTNMSHSIHQATNPHEFTHAATSSASTGVEALPSGPMTATFASETSASTSTSRTQPIGGTRSVAAVTARDTSTMGMSSISVDDGEYHVEKDVLKPTQSSVKDVIAFYRSGGKTRPGEAGSSSSSADMASVTSKKSVTKTLKTYQSLGQQGYFQKAKRSAVPKTTLERPAVDLADDDQEAGLWASKNAKAVAFPFPPVVSAEARASDSALLSYEKHPFVPRDEAEESLHAVLRRLSHVLHAEINKVVPTFPDSILKPPRGAAQKRFFPDGVWKEHRDYLTETLNRREDDPKAHEYKGNYKKDDEVVFFADRTPIHGKNAQDKRFQQNKTMYTRKRGHLRSIHAAVTWASVLSKHDKFADSGRHALLAERKIKQLSKKQSMWVGEQSALIRQRYQRCEHLISLLNEEIVKEERRAIGLLNNRLDDRQCRQQHIDVAKERVEVADRIMRILEEYGILSGSEVSDHLLYSLRQIKDVCGSQVSISSLSSKASKASSSKSKTEPGRKRKTKADKAIAMRESALQLGLAKPNPARSSKQASASTTASSLGSTTRTGKPNPGEQPLRPPSLYTPADETYKRRPEKRTTESFENAGVPRSNVRIGEYQDRALFPAAIAFSDTLYAGEEQLVADDAHRWPNGDLYGTLWSEGRGKYPAQEKSYLSGKIMDELRDMQIDQVTGKSAEKELPLFATLTEKSGLAPSKHKEIYSALLGRKVRVTKTALDKPRTVPSSQRRS